MSCDDARESLSALLDEALTPDERRVVEAHLEGCAECRGELERLRQTVALLHRVTPAHAPVGFVDRVVAAARPMPWYRRAAAAAFLPLWTKLPVEATALVMVALLAVYIFERTPALQQAARQEAPSPPRGRLAPPTRLVEEHEAVAPAPALRAAAPAPTAAPRDEDRRRDATVAREAAPLPASAPPASPPPPALVVPSVATPAEPPAPAVPPPPTPMPQSAAKAESSGERAAGAPRPDAENRQQALERSAGSTRAAPPASGLAAKRAQPSADVVARVSVKDRDAAERDLTQLIARVGGRETQRRREDDATIVEALIPQSRYVEFAEGLASIGTWRVEAERPDLPSQVHVILRLE